MNLIQVKICFILICLFFNNNFFLNFFFSSNIIFSRSFYFTKHKILTQNISQINQITFLVNVFVSSESNTKVKEINAKINPFKSNENIGTYNSLFRIKNLSCWLIIQSKKQKKKKKRMHMKMKIHKNKIQTQLNEKFLEIAHNKQT